jgi:hypothetical protein
MSGVRLTLGEQTLAERTAWAEKRAMREHENAMRLYFENEELLSQLVAHHGADRPSDELGIAFFTTPVNWRCPVCRRAKWEFARLNRKGWLHCRIVEHHDLFPEDFYLERVATVLKDWTGDLPPEEVAAFEAFGAEVSSLERFSRINICDDCNRADPHGKKAAGTPSYFTFAPHEIATFITPRIGAGVEVDAVRARATYQTIRPALAIISERAASILHRARTNPLLRTTDEVAA